MIDGELVLIHGFWSSPRTWDSIVTQMRVDGDLEGLEIDAFRYESPKVRLPLMPTRIPDYDDIAHSLGAQLALKDAARPLVIVTHSQGGLILQRHLAWMVHEGRAHELARVRAIVLLACPNEGSEYLGTIRRALGFGRHPQAGQLRTLVTDATDARRTFLKSIVHATELTDRTCPIPVYAYAGRTDNVVTRASAQSVYPNVSTLPGNHSSILKPNYPGSLTVQTLKAHIVHAFSGAGGTAPKRSTSSTSGTLSSAGSAKTAGSKYNVTLNDNQGVSIGDNNIQNNDFGYRS
ncbi:esterase/lipase family protein [Dactylosporangium darangshiense]|uniref:AB hydrolase-1 domain-containing protein n=1 Tax=Dactylosporangium darangshiense TaxID=579108 RepID=A0ABP8DVH7_9ACTN